MDSHYAYDHVEHLASHAEMDAIDSDRRKTTETTKRPVRIGSVTAPVEFGSGWYHDVAIADASQAHANPYR